MENSGWRWRFGIPQFRVVVHMLRMPKLPQGAKGTAEGRETQRMNSHTVPGEEELRSGLSQAKDRNILDETESIK